MKEGPTYTVEIEHWVSPTYDDRWTILYDLSGGKGQAWKRVLTFGSEHEARAAAALHGWIVKRVINDG